MSRFFTGNRRKTSWMALGSLKRSFAPPVPALSPLHVIHPISCQSAGLIALLCQQRCGKCRDGNVPAQREKSVTWSQLKSCSTRWQYGPVIWWHMSLKYPMNFMQTVFCLILTRVGEGRYFHSYMGSLELKQAKGIAVDHFQLRVFPGFHKQPLGCL